LQSLREALRDFAGGWSNDLADGWASALNGVQPNSDAVRDDLTFDPAEPIFPSRRGHALAGARADAHAFRAFDALPAARVRCVLLGQDPYPRIARATGRSFEQGDIATWPKKQSELATSLRTLVQFLAHARTGQTKYIGPGGWAEVRASAAAGILDLGTPRGLFDHWQAQGVLCLNAGLTLTRYVQGGAPEQLHGHLPFWQPIVGGVLRHLAARADGPIVFLLLGQPAQKLADAMGIRATAEAAGVWKQRVDEVRLTHPAAFNFLAGKNPFLEVDWRLAAMNGAPIGW
jgi:uracil-DNA glycosylase